MEPVPEITPHKKRKSELDYNLCIICQEKQANKDVTKSTAVESIVVLLQRCEKGPDLRTVKFSISLKEYKIFLPKKL